MGARTTEKTSHRQRCCLKQREGEMPWARPSRCCLPALPIHQETREQRSLGNVVPRTAEQSRAGNDCESKQANTILWRCEMLGGVAVTPTPTRVQPSWGLGLPEPAATV